MMRILHGASVSASTLAVGAAAAGDGVATWAAAAIAVVTALISIAASIRAAVRQARRESIDDGLAERWKAFALDAREKAIRDGQADPFPGGLPPLDASRAEK